MKEFLFVMATAVLIVAGAWFDFHVWRLEHPTAPVWCYFVGGH
jgi:hypothetical protein